MDTLYPVLLTFHNLNRWVLLLAAVWTVVAALSAGRSGPAGTALRRPVSLMMGSAHVQLLLGLLLFALMGMGNIPVFAGAPRASFQWEHLALGVLVAVFATLAGRGVRRAADLSGQTRAALVWGGLTLVISLLAIPWWRPLLRLFSV